MTNVDSGPPGETARGFRLRGRVQGVGFRLWVVRTAESAGLRGWVRNTSDGAVELHLSGDEAGMRLMEWELPRGPRGARVDDVHSIPVALDLPRRGIEVRE
jgi:acylphosphatase